MKIVGLITEYNPFHNGHQYHIQKITGSHRRRCSHCRDERRLRAERDSRHYAKASSCGNGIKMRCLCSL